MLSGGAIVVRAAGAGLLPIEQLTVEASGVPGVVLVAMANSTLLGLPVPKH